MTLTDAIFGPLLGTPTVESAVLNTLEAWLPAMLRVVERRHTLSAGLLRDPPGRNSYVGGIDFDSWQEDLCPMIIAVCKPLGAADRSPAGYGQAFSVEVGAVVFTETENESRVMAGHYGTAIMAAIAQRGDLGGIAAHTRLASAPIVEFIDPEARRLVLVRTPFESYIPGLVDELAGPKTPLPADSPQYGGTPGAPWSDAPAHTSTKVTVTGHMP